MIRTVIGVALTYPAVVMVVALVRELVAGLLA